MAEKVTGRSSHPSTNWLTWMYTFLPTGGAPNRTVYRLVMSAAPCTAPGHRPRTRKSRQISRPWLTGLEPRTMVFAPGSLGQPSLSATTPPVLVMENRAGARSGNCGRSGGASTWASPNWDSVQLILMNNWKPLSEPLWLKRLLLFASLAAAIQAVRWTSASARQRAATRLRVMRTSICEGVRGLAGLPPIRLTCPKGLFIETFRPRLPDCGMSNILPLQECSGSFSLSGIKVQSTQMEEDVRLETLFVPMAKGLFDQPLDFIV